MTSRDQHAYRILLEIEAGHQASQRSLARRVGIALGLTNLLLRRLARKGWIRVVKIRPNRVRYLLTPAGIAEKARMSRACLQNSVQFYAEARERIRERFATLSAGWSADGGGQTVEKRIVFYGTGEVAEIGYICLQETDLQLVGVIDDQGRQRFFGVPVHPPGRLDQSMLDGTGFGRLVVMSFGETDEILAQLEGLGLRAERAFWV